MTGMQVKLITLNVRKPFSRKRRQITEMTDIIDSFKKFEEIRKQYESMRSDAKNKLDDYRKKAHDAVDDFNRIAEMAGTDERLGFGDAGDNVSIDDEQEFVSVAELEAKDKEIASLKERIAKLESEEKDKSDEDDKPESTAADKPKRRKARKAPEPIDVENIDFTGSDDDPSVVVQDSKHESNVNNEGIADTAVQEKDETDSGEKQDDDIIDDKSTDVDDDEFMFL